MREPLNASAVVEAESDINLTPMLDVVFIMLIFFLVVASFIREDGLDVNRSDGRTTSDPVEENILVTIGEDNFIWIDGRLIDPRAVRANIKRLHSESPGATVVIRADRHSANKTLVQVMDASRQAGVDQIALASPDR